MVLGLSLMNVFFFSFFCLKVILCLKADSGFLIKGKDGSIMFLFLIMVVFFVMVKSGFLVLKNKPFHMFLFMVLFFLLLVCFCSKNLFFFFVFMELSMIPMVFLMLGWGSNPERPLASGYLFLYTFLGSLPLLMKIILFYTLAFTFEVWYYHYTGWNVLYVSVFDGLMWMIIPGSILVFLIKMPVLGLHKWLPKAHVEASALGSIVLAAMLLKLGVFGLLLLNKVVPLFWVVDNSNIYLIWMTFGYILCSVFCLSLIDFKVLMAYSSMVHMSLVSFSLFICNFSGLFGSLVVSLSHGLISASLFFIVGVLYNYSNSRSLLLKGGWSMKKSLFYFFLVVLVCLNFSFPPFLSFFGEIVLVSKVLKSFIWLSAVMVFGVLFIGLYNMLFLVYLSHGVGFLKKTLNISAFFFLFFFCFFVVFSVIGLSFWV